jgi:hypothetical protein
VRAADGTRRVVSADEPASAPRRPTSRSSSDRTRRLAQITRELAADRDQHLVQVEAELAQARALRTGASTHFGVEFYRARPVSYAELAALNEAGFRPRGAR